MMKRVYTKIGDVFSVKINDNSKKYFQLIAFDKTQLNSDVIRAFKRVYPINSNPDLLEIVNGEVEFYAHCATKWGVKSELWEKIGSTKEIGNTSEILFRDTDDYGTFIDGEHIKVSHNWFVWHINDEDFNYVGKLRGNNRNAEIGIVIAPCHILDRIKTGKYNFVYPDFI